jgi:hypothetical protein
MVDDDPLALTPAYHLKEAARLLADADVARTLKRMWEEEDKMGMRSTSSPSRPPSDEDKRQARLVLADEIQERLHTCMMRTKWLVENGATLDEETGFWTLAPDAHSRP